MQRSVLKNICFLSVFFTFSIVAAAQPATLAKADSLFAQKRYTQSLELYQHIFDSQHYTPAMLVKMAYIQEGLNNPARAIYYLNLYYLATRDDAAKAKIDELAAKFKLEGYEFSETDKLVSLYLQYRMPLAAALAALAVLLVSALVFTRRKGYNPTALFILLVINLLALAAHVNMGNLKPDAIIAQPRTYIMSGPSAGASVITVARAGHRVAVLGSEDVWVKVRWNDKVAYIKQDNLLAIRL